LEKASSNKVKAREKQKEIDEKYTNELDLLNIKNSKESYKFLNSLSSSNSGRPRSALVSL